jgi:hypothetical protein
MGSGFEDCKMEESSNLQVPTPRPPLGLVSTPLWPIIAGGAEGFAVGYSAWKAVHFFGWRK